MKTYLITGGAGFIGANFVQHMLSEHDDLLIVNVDKLTYAGNLENLRAAEGDARHVFVHADICDREKMLELFSSYEPDYVVNFAAESHVDRSILNPAVFAETNVLGTLTLLEAARQTWEQGDGRYGSRKFVQISTDEVYGSLSLDEPDVLFTEQTPIAPRSPYSASKAAADLFVQAYSDTYQLPVNITRSSNNYGPYQFPEKLIPLMINNALQHKPLPVYGDGLNVRDWLYVKDHCKAIDLVIDKAVPGEIYNIGGMNERSNIDIVKTIIGFISLNVDATVSDELITYVQDRKGHDRRYAIDPTRITSELGWQPETAFEDGIKETITWYLENDQWVQNVVSGSYQDYYAMMYEGR